MDKLVNTERPIHPWISSRGLAFPDQSPLWHDGPNAAADAVVFNQDRPEVLLIQRSDSTWASAGGFIDETDQSKAHAAAREAYEEAGVTLEPSMGLPVYEGIVDDSRASKYSWVTTAAFLWRTSLQLDALQAGDDAQNIRLMDLADVQGQPLSGSHNYLIQEAVERYGTLLEKLRYYKNTLQLQPVSGGHMEYNHAINILPSGQTIYTKQHTPNSYMDTARAERSLAYLQKEANIYNHLKANGYSRIPKNVDYSAGTLAMDAMTQPDGWVWRHPTDSSQQEVYVQDVLQALDELEKIPPSNGSNPNIAPSIVSFAEEGWASYDENNKQIILHKLDDYTKNAQNHQLSEAALKLMADLDGLKQMAQRIDYSQAKFFCHHDFRESNVAWHPLLGARIIDWSWAGPGLIDSDKTTFLIDLHKRGVDVTKHMQGFNRDHAITMIGFWLMHATWPNYGKTDVRFQQLHSAVSAYDLLLALK